MSGGAIIAKFALELVMDKASDLLHAKDFERAQEFIDNECVEKMKPYIPVSIPRYSESGKLADSVKISEPGKIIFTAPFAKIRYYQPWKSRITGNPNGASLWFEVMKERHADEILRGAQKAMKGQT